MSVGSHLSDFVGYDVGIPPVSPTPTVGFSGFLDFVGFPVGVLAVVPPTPSPTRLVGGASFPDPLYRKKRRLWEEDDEILILRGVL